MKLYMKRDNSFHLLLGVDGPLGGHKQVVSKAFSAKGTAAAKSLGLKDQNAIAGATGVVADSAAKALSGHASSVATGVKSATSKAISLNKGHAYSKAHSRGNTLSMASSKYNAIAAAVGRKRRAAYIPPSKFFFIY